MENISYNVNGYIVTYKEHEDETMYIKYDAWNRVVLIEDGKNKIQFAYDFLGDLIMGKASLEKCKSTIKEALVKKFFSYGKKGLLEYFREHDCDTVFKIEQGIMEFPMIQMHKEKMARLFVIE